MVVDNVALHTLVSLNQRFLRSVHLERDFYAADAAEGYLITRGSLAALSQLSRGIGDSSYRAQCISGPYGSGKSALALFFARLLDKLPSNGLRSKAQQFLSAQDGLVLPSGEGYITILATGTRENIASALVRSLKQSLEKSGRTALLSELTRKHKILKSTGAPSTRDVIALYQELAKLACEKENAVGVVTIVDELGKLLEFAASHPDDSDIQILQEMAEAASRSNGHPLWFVTILHQQFSQYASRLGKKHQREWARVQQRFYDVTCSLDGLDALQLVASAINASGSEAIRSNPRIREAIRSCLHLAPRGAAEDYEKLCVDCYPLHPTTLAVLPSLFRRFGQNERSLFSFLSADEPFSLGDWMHSQQFDANVPRFLGLPEIYDYACHTLIGGAPTPQIAHAWAEVEDAIMRLGEASPEEVDALKTVGLLGLAGESSRLPASKYNLEIALSSTIDSRTQIDAALKNLIDRKLIVFRHFRNAYRLWEGSDIDINERLAEAPKSLDPTASILRVAKELCPSAPVIARRHSFKTGMLRAFSINPICKDDLLTAFEVKDDCDGRVFQCLVENDEQISEVREVLQRLKDPSVIIMIGKETDELVEAAAEVAALEWVRNNTPQLAGDRVARQELSERRLEAESAFRQHWSDIFNPGSGRVTCVWMGQESTVLTGRAFASLVSDACDATFPSAPIVQNELINRRSLSSAAAAARRNLIEAMLTKAELAGLGIEGYPPERSIYESLLLTSGIHRQNTNGVWELGRPDGGDANLQKSWDCILQEVISDKLRPKQIAQLFKKLSGSPYGVAEGFLPVLLCAVLIVHSSTMALYEEKAFVSELSVPVMERLMRRPEIFALLSFDVAGERAAVVDRFARGFGVENRVLPVVRSLYKRMSSLPKYTEMTKNLPPNAIAVRDAILRSKSPERLLFVELPLALGSKPFEPSVHGVENDNVERFFTALNDSFDALINCYPGLLERVRKGLLQMFDVDSAMPDWRAVVSSRATKLYEVASESRLRTLTVRVMDDTIPESEYMESVGAGILGQPPSRWNRADEDSFARLVPQLASQVRNVESAMFLNTALEVGEDGYLVSINTKDGEGIRQVVRLSSNERQEVDKLAEKVASGISSITSQRVLLAAVTEAARRLILAQCTQTNDESNEELKKT